MCTFPKKPKIFLKDVDIIIGKACIDALLGFESVLRDTLISHIIEAFYFGKVHLSDIA